MYFLITISLSKLLLRYAFLNWPAKLLNMNGLIRIIFQKDEFPEKIITFVFRKRFFLLPFGIENEKGIGCKSRTVPLL